MLSVVNLCRIPAVLTALLLVSWSVEAKEGDEFPGRSLFPTIDVMEIDELRSRLDQVTVVDVRSDYEYQTLRIKGAKHVQLGTKTFADEMRALRAQDPQRPIVVYCNGKTCMKSYKAARECKIENIEGVVAYDAGIMDWAKAYPDQAELLGKSPVDPKRLLSKDKFSSHTLAPEKFEAEAGKNNVIVVDMRDRFQREATSLFVGKEQRVYLDDQASLDKLIAEAKRDGKTLLIYDQAGKQVQWLQYYLEDKDLANYYFMKGGSREYFKYLRAQL